MFIFGDLFEADLSDATVVTMYLSPNILKRLEPGLRALKPGTRIVSHQFPMAGWIPDKRTTVDEAELLLWVVPARGLDKIGATKDNLSAASTRVDAVAR